jgi:rhodanese-related sulfurtransferase
MSLLNRVGWSILKQTIRAEFPQVHQISPDTLTDWLDSEQADLVLLDTRTEAEYAVSHLANARQVDPKIENLASLELAIDTPIVTYCSVGYRSARIADRLQTAGYTNVVNLEGSFNGQMKASLSIETDYKCKKSIRLIRVGRSY